MPKKKARARKSVRKPDARARKIDEIVEKVREMCEYAVENLCVQSAQFEELEWMLNQAVK